MNVEIELEAEYGFVVDHGADPSVLFDRLMTELVNSVAAQSGLADPAVSVDLATGTASVELVATAETFDDAVALADSSVRSAAQAAGWNSAAWRVVKQAQRAERISA